MEKMYAKYLATGKIKRRYTFVFIIFLLFTLLSLFSYNASDACLNVISNYKITNLGGKYGAILSDLLLQYFGLSAYFFTFVLLYWSFNVLYVKRFKHGFLKLQLLLFETIIVSILLSSITRYRFILQMFPGGYLGYYLYHILSSIMHKFVLILSLLSISTVFLYLMFYDIGKIKNKLIAFVKKKFKILLIYINPITFFKKIINILFKILKLTFYVLFKKNRKKNKEVKVAKNKKLESKVENEEIAEKIVKKVTKQPEFVYSPPSIDLLKDINQNNKNDESLLKANVIKLSKTLEEFGIRGDILGYQCGPVVTLYEFKPYPGIKASRIICLADDIARNMKVASVRISIIVGKDTMAIEIPNQDRSIVSFKELIKCSKYKESDYNLPIILGCDIFGQPIIADLATMPHLLVAGTTGSGKSVGMNGMILSILYKLSPEDCKFIMIDPKMLEFAMYNDIPHLLMPVINDSKNAVLSLKWVVREMENRYRKMAQVGVRNIYGFNEKVETDEALAEEKKMPFIIVVIDEMADLMVVAGKEVEVLVQRLSQMARAAGIHLLMATQRPSVDVITGVIKANFPTRISYQVTSKIDSRTILGEQGAEQLLGRGDMLYMKSGGKATRVHGPFISDNEVESITNYLKNTYEVKYIDVILTEDEDGGDDSDIGSGYDGEGGDLYQQAVRIVLQDKKTSISYIQRKLRIGYNKAANLVEQMEQDGLLSEPDHTGKRIIIKSSTE